MKIENPKTRAAFIKFATSPRLVHASRALELGGFLALLVATSFAVFRGAPWIREVGPEIQASASFVAIIVALLAIATGEFFAVFGREFALARRGTNGDRTRTSRRRI